MASNRGLRNTKNPTLAKQMSEMPESIGISNLLLNKANLNSEK